MNRGNNGIEIIEAIIWLKPTDEGWRAHPKGVGWRPHLCMTEGHKDQQGQPIYMGVSVSHINAGETEWLQPGKSGEVTFQLMYFDADKPHLVEVYAPLQRGREFEIREGAKTVGYGCVQSRINVL